VSHQPERKEKNCLNCGTTVQGRFCQNCGQENVVTHQNFWSLSKHFIFDIFHFDGRFFDTLRFLLFKPGYVAKEYVSGKRSKYLDPIRMYLFTSALFFLVLFSASHIDLGSVDVDKSVTLSNKDRIERAERYKDRLKRKPTDTLLRNKIALLLDTSRLITLKDIQDDSVMEINSRYYHSSAEYDSLQKRLPDAERDGWLMQKGAHKTLELNEKYHGNADLLLKSLLNSFIHRFPYILFISLPFFAGLLKLLYVRKKSFYYSDHAVFTLYHYIFSFIILLIIVGAIRLGEVLNWGLFGWIAFILVILWFVYLYKGMRNFYGQSRGKTFLKFLLLNFTGFVLIAALLLFFFLFTAYQL
jgi:hypothetical protein